MSDPTESLEPLRYPFRHIKAFEAINLCDGIADKISRKMRKKRFEKIMSNQHRAVHIGAHRTSRTSVYFLFIILNRKILILAREKHDHSPAAAILVLGNAVASCN